MIAGAVALAALGWAFAFGLSWGSFWLRIGLAVSVVCGYSLAFERPDLRVTVRGVAEGLASAAALYLVFWVGHALSPHVVPGAHAEVGSIYAMGEGSSRLGVFLLLLLVTGPGEEIFWRGFLQDALQRRLRPGPGYLAATAVYGGVHVFSGNLMLVLAALVAGAFWGGLYLWRKDLAALVVSHSVWSAVIFAVWPIR